VNNKDDLQAVLLMLLMIVLIMLAAAIVSGVIRVWIQIGVGAG